MAVKTKAQIEQDQLKNDVNDLKEMMKMFIQSQTQSNKIDTDIKAPEKESVSEYEDLEEVVSIPPNQLINVTSLFTGGMTLTGSHGKPIRFERFGQTMPVTFEDVNYACSNNRKFAEEGYFFIHSGKAVKLLYLNEAYEKIIDVKTIENLINLSTDKIEEIYNKVTQNIKDSIIDIVVRGIIANKPAYSDRNKIDFLGKLRGKDLNVIAKNIQEYEVK